MKINKQMDTTTNNATVQRRTKTSQNAMISLVQLTKTSKNHNREKKVNKKHGPFVNFLA